MWASSMALGAARQHITSYFISAVCICQQPAPAPQLPVFAAEAASCASHASSLRLLLVAATPQTCLLHCANHRLQEKIRAKLQERADKAREQINVQVGAKGG